MLIYIIGVKIIYILKLVYKIIYVKNLKDPQDFMILSNLF